MTFEREITKDASLENLGAIREFIEESCDEAEVPLNVKFDLVLAVDEVCTNVVQHGYKDKKDGGPLSVEFERSDDIVIITVSDKGKPFNPEDAPPPELTPDWKERPVGGLGLFFLKEIADEVAYQTRDDMNYLKMVKHLTDDDDEDKDKEDDKKDGKKTEAKKDDKAKGSKAKSDKAK